MPGVGRIQIRARTAQEFKRRDGIITKLVEGGHLETLRLLKRGTLTITDLVEADRQERLTHLTDDVLAHRPFLTTFEDWLNNKKLAEKTRKDYRERIKRMVAVAQELSELPTAPAIADLERVDWDRLHANWKGSDYDWQNVRIPLSSFLSNALKRALRPLRERVIPFMPVPHLPKHKNAVSPHAFWRAVKEAPEPLRPCFVTMAVLGVGPGEYGQIEAHHLDEEQHLVHVPGTKNRYRNRDVKVDDRLWGWIEASIPAPIGEQMLRRHWNAACEAAKTGRMRLYDLRHLSGQLASAAGVPVQDISAHMGHSKISTTMDYLEGRRITAAAKGIADTLLTEEALPLPGLV
ncbi:MAG: hypothetical protein ACREN3_01975 [Gemmatimonadaceae bacterium]